MTPNGPIDGGFDGPGPSSIHWCRPLVALPVSFFDPKRQNRKIRQISDFGQNLPNFFEVNGSRPQTSSLQATNTETDAGMPGHVRANQQRTQQLILSAHSGVRVVTEVPLYRQSVRALCGILADV
jgi:hypothetical protein